MFCPLPNSQQLVNMLLLTYYIIKVGHDVVWSNKKNEPLLLFLHVMPY